MKRKFGLAFFILIASISISKGQFRLLKSIDDIEFSIGPSIVSLHNKNLSDIRQPKIGYTIRLNFLEFLDDNIILNTGLYFERKGLKTKYKVSYYDPRIDSSNCMCTTSDGYSKNDVSMNYATLNPQLRILLTKSKFYIDLGFYLSYLLKSNSKTINLWDNTTYYNNNIDQNRKFDFGCSLSLGYRITMNKRVVNFILSENYGILNITNPDFSSTTTNTNAFSFTISLNLKNKL
jgi:hypothetical protein